MKEEDVYRHCVRELHGFAMRVGFSEAVLGLSGGMDSSLVAVMCADAFGAEHVHGVLLPGPYTSRASQEDAWDLGRNAGIDVFELSILEEYKAFERSLVPVCQGRFDGLPAQNVQARCRMVKLMALSNAYGWMLVNTSNKSESYMGYSTLYGDSVGAFAPLGNLYKTEVYALARWRNECAIAQGKKSLIPQRVFDKPPSAELAPDQEDEKSLGISYVRLDALLQAFMEESCSKEMLLERGFDAEEISLVSARCKASEFKRRLAPPAPVRVSLS